MGDSVTKSQVLRIVDLAVASPAIRGRRFEDCLILGPAVIAFSGTNTFDECGFEGDVEALLWEIPAERSQVIGLIEVVDCEFIRCRFQGVGFAGLKEFVDNFRTNMTPVQS